MSSHRLADKASCRSTFCKLFGMLTELAPPASAHLIHCLLKDILDLLLRCFCLTAHLSVIWCGNPVINSNFCESFPEGPINEVRSSIIDDYSSDSGTPDTDTGHPRGVICYLR
jgi:hypothetical protein